MTDIYLTFQIQHTAVVYLTLNVHPHLESTSLRADYRYSTVWFTLVMSVPWLSRIGGQTAGPTVQNWHKHSLELCDEDMGVGMRKCAQHHISSMRPKGWTDRAPKWYKQSLGTRVHGWNRVGQPPRAQSACVRRAQSACVRHNLSCVISDRLRC
jgi:hypothetical protein